MTHRHHSAIPDLNRAPLWGARLAQLRERVQAPPSLVVEGKLTRMVGLTMEAVGCHAAIGTRCMIIGADGDKVESEVVGFSGDKLFLMPTGAQG